MTSHEVRMLKSHLDKNNKEMMKLVRCIRGSLLFILFACGFFMGTYIFTFRPILRAMLEALGG